MVWEGGGGSVGSSNDRWGGAGRDTGWGYAPAGDSWAPEEAEGSRHVKKWRVLGRLPAADWESQWEGPKWPGRLGTVSGAEDRVLHRSHRREVHTAGLQ